MEHLPRDRRGLPIPFIVMIGPDGVPDFKINDSAKLARCIEEGLCAVSGLPMDRTDVWFIGGPNSAYHPTGAFVDPPGKRVCLEWAARVCPFIAMGRFEGFKSVRPKSAGVAIAVDTGVQTGKPPYFVLARCNGYTWSPETGYFHPVRPWISAQHWQDGERIEVLNRPQIVKAMDAQRIRYRTEPENAALPVWLRQLNRGVGAGTFPWQR
jgi:hypothetical protein